MSIKSIEIQPSSSLNGVSATTEESPVTSIIVAPGVRSGEATSISVTPYGTITSTNLQDALQELADQSFRGSGAPSGNNLEEGDTWYKADTDQYYVYRETSPGVLEWVPIILGDAGSSSDILDAGAF